MSRFAVRSARSAFKSTLHQFLARPAHDRLRLALPTLAGSLHASATDLQWFVSAYTLALAVGLLPGGLLGDRFGRKKVMMATLAVFGLSSLACAFASGPGEFIAARTVLGLSAGFMIPLVLSIVIGFGIGLGLDHLFHTRFDNSSPVGWFTVVFTLLGIIAGFREMIRTVIRISEDEDRSAQ